MSKLSERPQPHYLGHRQRLRDRFAAAPGSLADYELLELLLMIALPRRDVKPLAKALIDRFGSYAAALSAPADQLAQISGMGDISVTVLKTVRESAVRLAREDIINRPALGSWQAVVDYCRAAMAFEPREQFRILFLDRKNVLVADELQQQGTIDHTPVYPREVIKRALELNASAVILVHNHPSGDPKPSREDIDLTKQIVKIAQPLGVAVHDHLVIGKKGHASFKSLGLL